MAENWYNAVNLALDQDGAPAPAEPAARRAPERAQTGTAAPDPDDGRRFLEVIDLQATQLARLSQLNERLMDRVETLLQIQEREQVLRQQLQNQVDRLSERADVPAPARVSAPVPDAPSPPPSPADDLKPLLMTIVDLLERTLPRPRPADPPVPAPAEARPDPAELPDLPEFLRQPRDAEGPAARPNGAASGASTQPPPALDRGTPPPRAPRARLPESFAWTSLFS